MTIAGGPAIAGATTTANTGYRTASGLPVFAGVIQRYRDLKCGRRKKRCPRRPAIAEAIQLYVEARKRAEETPPKPKLLSIDLDEPSRAELLRRIPAAHPNAQGHHITLRYDPSEEELAHFQKHFAGKGVTFHVTHAAGDDRAQAVRVALHGKRHQTWHKAKPDMHITVSTAPGVSAAHSNQMLAAAEHRSTRLPSRFALSGTYTVRQAL